MKAKRRKKAYQIKTSHDRWLVSYADFITLLFAFFVVMYAISSVNEGKYRVLSNALENVFKNTTQQPVKQSLPPAIPAPTPSASIVPSPITEISKEQTKGHMKKIAEGIISNLQPLAIQGKVRLLETPRGITIEINDSVLFPSGQAKLHPASVQALIEIAKSLLETDFPITIEGHTDNTPISTTQFPSNWELSALRATLVLRVFAESGIDASRLTAIGYGDTRPIETNTTVTGRGRNRRVSISIDSEKAKEGRELPETN